MPAKHIVKTYINNGIYHVYNRGVEKRDIFLDTQDYKVFLGYLKDALSYPNISQKQKISFYLKGGTFQGMPKQPKNFHNRITLFAYCLMPNHFHLLLQQTDKDDMKLFMRSVMTRFSMYFNKKYKRVGGLFQNHYKASIILEEPYLLHLSRYIHRNPLTYTKDLLNAYSSYANYLMLRHTQWVKPDFILSFFQTKHFRNQENYNSYKDFVEIHEDRETEKLGSLILEDEDIE